MFDKSRDQMTTIEFLRLSVNHEHSFGVGGANVTDQFRGSCRFDHWLHKYECWHSMFWWGVQVFMVTSCKSCCECVRDIGEKSMSHCEHQKMIAHAWMDKG